MSTLSQKQHHYPPNQWNDRFQCWTQTVTLRSLNLVCESISDLTNKMKAMDILTIILFTRTKCIWRRAKKYPSTDPRFLHDDLNEFFTYSLKVFRALSRNYEQATFSHSYPKSESDYDYKVGQQSHIVEERHEWRHSNFF